jgi:hypothetical protein
MEQCTLKWFSEIEKYMRELQKVLVPSYCQLPHQQWQDFSDTPLQEQVTWLHAHKRRNWFCGIDLKDDITYGLPDVMKEKICDWKDYKFGDYDSHSNDMYFIDDCN